MTIEALTALERVRAEFGEVIRSLSDDEWLRPSACAGWRVRDVVAHVAITAREAVETPSADDGALAADRERHHDAGVDERRSWTVGEVLEEYETYAPKALELLAGAQEEPIASMPMTIPGLGTYPIHAFANAAVYDSYCHLRYDILGPRGPIDRTVADASHDVVHAAIQWLMWQLPQTPGIDLAGALRAPTTIALTGPGESSWTISGRGHDGLLLVEEGDEGDVTVVSSGHDFIGWATKRTDWRTSCTIRGDETLVEGFLDTLNTI